MIRLALPLALLALLLPATAEAACGVPQARAEYETPEVQVYASKGKLIACVRATGKALVVGQRSNDGMGTDESDYTVGLIGGRWLHTALSATFSESYDVRIDTLRDLRTNKAVKATVFDEDTDNQVIAVPGALISAGEEGVAARFTDGRREVLSATAGAAPAAVGARVYWRDVTAAHTAVLTLPEVGAAPAPPRARTLGRCKPRAGARLLEQNGYVVITRAGGATWACRRGKTRRVGVTTAAWIMSDRYVAYGREGFAGVLDVASGTRRELETAGGPVAATEDAVAAVGAGGLSAWTLDRSAATLLSPGPATEVALGEALSPTAYWLDAAGAPQFALGKS